MSLPELYKMLVAQKDNKSQQNDAQLMTLRLQMTEIKTFDD